MVESVGGLGGAADNFGGPKEKNLSGGCGGLRG